MASSISRALRATPQLIRLSSVSRQAVVAKAKEAFKRKMIETGEPDPRGALILEHNHPEHGWDIGCQQRPYDPHQQPGSQVRRTTTHDSHKRAVGRPPTAL